MLTYYKDLVLTYLTFLFFHRMHDNIISKIVFCIYFYLQFMYNLIAVHLSCNNYCRFITQLKLSL